MKYVYLILCLALLPMLATAVPGDTVYIHKHESVLLKKGQLYIFKDVSGSLPFDKIRTLGVFEPVKSRVPNLGLSKSAIWLRFTLFNKTDEDKLVVNVGNPLLNHVTFFYPLYDSVYTTSSSGNLSPISERKYRNQHILFEVPIAPYSSKTVYLKVQSNGQMPIPVYAGVESAMMESVNHDDLIFGLYLGVIVVMLFYNLFVYFSVKEDSYLYYVCYILMIGFTQFCLQGYGYRFLWSHSPFITSQSINWSGALSGIATALFVRVFLHTKEKMPFVDHLLIGFVVVYTVSIIMTLAGIYDTSYILIDVVAFIGSFVAWYTGLWLSLKGFRPAKFFMAAWSFFLGSIILYVIKDFGIIPYNLFTNNILLIGSSIEVSLLSFALADKINIYKKEKEVSQAEALRISQENERLVLEQNLVLEAKVQQRTVQLQNTNEELNTALDNLKATQSQLVEAEKMASLGQLTAGIAHEINNPINFVKANIKPLQLDMQDLWELIEKFEKISPQNIGTYLEEINAYKDSIDLEYIRQEMDTLIHGIEDGANRTAEIVQGLRTFSRLDESEVKEADIHECLDGTLVLLRSTIPENIRIIRNYDGEARIECYPGKINQVFMNILTNAIQAIKSKPYQGDESITICTSHSGECLQISIADTGPGIPPAAQEKIFTPFFTTKEVGEGVGLGLSIVFGIINKHQGKIIVNSREGEGAEFVITLPVVQKASS